MDIILQLTFQLFKKFFFILSQIALESKIFIEDLNDFQFPFVHFFPEPLQEVDRLLARVADGNADDGTDEKVSEFGLGYHVTASQGNKP